jgi:hypothetical protein
MAYQGDAKETLQKNNRCYTARISIGGSPKKSFATQIFVGELRQGSGFPHQATICCILVSHPRPHHAF